MNFKTKKFISLIICILSVYTLFASCIDFIAFNRKFYSIAYSHLNTAEKIGMSETALYDATDTLLDYLQDYRDDIKVKAIVKGEEREIFDARETLHMVDVKNLYLRAMFVRNVCLVLVLFLLWLLYYDDKKNMKYALSYVYSRFLVIFSLGLGFLIVYALSDFSKFWTLFHKIFFSNDLWLLNPNVSIMINMFPEEFFYAMVFSIAGCFALILIGLWIYSIVYQRKCIKENNNG